MCRLDADDDERCAGRFEENRRIDDFGRGDGDIG